MVSVKVYPEFELDYAFLLGPMNDESKAATTTKTPLAFFQFNNMPFSMTEASAIFLNTLKQLLMDNLEEVSHYDNDLLVNWLQ